IRWSRHEEDLSGELSLWSGRVRVPARPCRRDDAMQLFVLPQVAVLDGVCEGGRVSTAARAGGAHRLPPHAAEDGAAILAPVLLQPVRRPRLFRGWGASADGRPLPCGERRLPR